MKQRVASPACIGVNDMPTRSLALAQREFLMNGRLSLRCDQSQGFVIDKPRKRSP